MNFWLLVDANNTAARSHHKMKELMTSDGVLTGALYGFLKSVSWVRNKLGIPLQRTVIIWDGGHAQWRKDIFPTYKQGRKLNEPNTPEEEADKIAYQAQLKIIQQVLSYTDCRQVKVKGVEADDIIGLLASLNTENGDHTWIYSGDKDMHQLASSKTHIFDPHKNELTVDKIEEIWGVTVEQILLKKAIWGDSSDKIPGVTQVGDKRSTTVCSLVSYENGRFHFSQDTENKHVHRVWEELDVVERNLELMTLPRSVEDWKYPLETAEEAISQFLTVREMDNVAFLSAIDRFELDPITLAQWG